MVRFPARALMFLLTGFLVFGCAGQKPQKAQFQPYMFPEGKYQKAVDNFLIIFDDSSSMSDKYKGAYKICQAVNTVSLMNQTIPEYGFKGGIRTFGQGACVGGGNSSLLYGLTQYTTAGMDAALNRITCTGGNTPLGEAIDMAAGDLKSVSGKSAVIIVSDGIVLDNYPVVAAQNLKKAMGEDVCLYTVQIGNNPGGKAMLKQVADAGGCGFAVSAEEIAGAQDMAGFVKLALLAEVPKMAAPAPKPAPKPAPPAPAPVAKPMPGDADGDGVLDGSDRCPQTPRGARVDERGCWVIDNVMFDFDKSDIKKRFTYVLDEVAYVLENNPYVTVEIQGNADSIGKESYNLKLSERRAEAVKRYLVGKGIASHRLKTKGFGATRPIATNLTEEGRAKNRRVEFAPIW